MNVKPIAKAASSLHLIPTPVLCAVIEKLNAAASLAPMKNNQKNRSNFMSKKVDFLLSQQAKRPRRSDDGTGDFDMDEKLVRQIAFGFALELRSENNCLADVMESARLIASFISGSPSRDEGDSLTVKPNRVT